MINVDSKEVQLFRLIFRLRIDDMDKYTLIKSRIMLKKQRI